MAGTERRKASDNFKNSPVPKTNKPIIESFPNVSRLEVEVTDDRGQVILNKSNRQVPEVVNCNEGECAHGGLNIGEDVRDVLRSGQTEKRITRGCPGYWGSPQGRRKRRKCMQVFHITIRVNYVQAPGASG